MAWLDTDERSAPSPLATLHILGEQLCPQQSTVALCQPPYPRLPACLLDRNVPSDPVQAILLILRTVTGCGEAGGQRGLCRLSSFAALSFDFQLPLFPWEALGSWAAQGIKAERMGVHSCEKWGLAELRRTAVPRHGENYGGEGCWMSRCRHTDG